MAGRFLLPFMSTLLPSSIHATTPVGHFTLDSLFSRRCSIFPFYTAIRLLRSPRILFHSLSSSIMNPLVLSRDDFASRMLHFFLVFRCCTLYFAHVRMFFKPLSWLPETRFRSSFFWITFLATEAKNFFSPVTTTDRVFEQFCREIVEMASCCCGSVIPCRGLRGINTSFYYRENLREIFLLVTSVLLIFLSNISWMKSHGCLTFL